MQAESPLIFFFTDFGAQGPYLGQMEGVILNALPGARIINLLSDAPRMNAQHSSYLLTALSDQLPQGAILVCVVDPGVGGERLPLVVRSGDRYYIGPDNGLFSGLVKEDLADIWVIQQNTQGLSDTFHGRDLFAPTAVAVAKGDFSRLKSASTEQLVGLDWPADLWEIIYFDHYGNAFTGIKGRRVPKDQVLYLNDLPVKYARTFCEAQSDNPFWYVNSCGLVEIAMSEESARDKLAIKRGDLISPTPSSTPV